MIGGGPQKITVEIGGKIAASLGKALRESQRQVSTFGRNVNRSMNDAAIAGKKGFKGIFDNALWQQASIGAAGIGLALAGSVRVAARFESVLADVGKTANVGGAELKKLSAQVLQLSGRNVTNLGPEKLAQGIQDLVAQGLNLNDAVASMETLGKVATATGSDLLDVTKTGFQLQNALKIRPTELKATFDALAFAGKQGAFELKDMAQFMPTIAAAAGTLTSFQNSTQRLGVAVGNSLLPPLTALAGLITPLAEGIAGFAANNPAMTTVLVTIGGLAAGLVLVLPIIAGVVSAIGALTATFPVLAGIGTVIAVAGGPITLIIAGVVLLGIAIESLVRNWDSVKRATAGAWQGVVATWGKFTGWIGNVFNQALGVIRAWGSKVLGVMRSIPAMIISMFTGSNLGQRIMTSIIDGLKAKAGALFGWIRNTWSNITGFFGGGAVPAPAGGAAPAAASSSPGRNAAGGGRRPPGRALGGPVTAGMPYIVGEKRRELFVPGMDGAIIPRIARPAATPKTPPININPPVARQAPTPAPITINAPVTINATGDGAGIRDQVRAAFEDLMAMASSGYRVALND